MEFRDFAPVDFGAGDKLNGAKPFSLKESAYAHKFNSISLRSLRSGGKPGEYYRIFIEGPSPSTQIRSRFPLHPSLRLWMEHPSREKVKADMRSVEGRGIDFSGSDFTRADLTDAVLNGANFTDCIFNWAWLIEADLRQATLERVSFVGARVSETKLSGDRKFELGSTKGAVVDNVEMSLAAAGIFSRGEKMNEHEKERLREALRKGAVDEADRAMSQLLDVASAEMLDPRDLIASLEAMERLGEHGQAQMFESFIMFASRFPEVSVPALTACLSRSPLSWSGSMSAAVIYEVVQHVPGGRAQINREAVIAALCAAVDAAASAGTDSIIEVISTLHDWAAWESMPEAGPAIARFLMRAADEESPKEYVLRLARETLEANGQVSLLSQVRERARSLPSNHPLQHVVKA